MQAPNLYFTAPCCCTGVVLTNRNMKKWQDTTQIWPTRTDKMPRDRPTGVGHAKAEGPISETQLKKAQIDLSRHDNNRLSEL